MKNTHKVVEMRLFWNIFNHFGFDFSFRRNSTRATLKNSLRAHECNFDFVYCDTKTRTQFFLWVLFDLLFILSKLPIKSSCLLLSLKVNFIGFKPNRKYLFMVFAIDFYEILQSIKRSRSFSKLDMKSSRPSRLPTKN